MVSLVSFLLFTWDECRLEFNQDSDWSVWILVKSKQTTLCIVYSISNVSKLVESHKILPQEEPCIMVVKILGQSLKPSYKWN